MKKYITLENKLYESFLVIDLDKIKSSNQLIRNKTNMSKAEKTKEINFLRKEMETAAKALNFIEAARIRDLITELKK